jgi:diketogulonate reductase-like aldo/keto reductase
VPRVGQAARRAPGAHRRREIAALQAGIELGLTLINAAEGAEDLVGEAIARRRDGLFLVAWLAPEDATLDGMVRACTATLRRLGTDRLDLYLLHGRGTVDLEECIEGFAALRDGGMIRDWGVADFALPALAEVLALGGRPGAVEVRYGLAARGAEWDLLDRCQAEGLPVLAYTPLELRAHPRLLELAQRHGATPAQLELAWLLSHEGLAAIAPVETPEHAAEQRAALDVRLDGHDHAMLDEAFPPPRGPQPIARIG